jgi:hypothetical protein
MPETLKLRDSDDVRLFRVTPFGPAAVVQAPKGMTPAQLVVTFDSLFATFEPTTVQ